MPIRRLRIRVVFVGCVTRARAPLSFGVAATLLVLVATLASLVPARRAARVDPALSLQAE